MFEELKKQMDQALNQFKAQGADITALKSEIEDVKRKLTAFAALQARMGMDPRTPSGFQDPDHAKGFVDFARAVLFPETDSSKALSGASDPEGGYLVGPEYLPVLIRLVETFGIIRPDCTVIPMKKDEMTVPRLSSGARVYWIGERKTITDGSPAFGNVKLIAKKMASLVPVSGELLEDASLPIANLLATLFAEAIAEEEDRVSLAGDLTAGDPFAGVLHDADVTVTTLGSGDTGFDDFDADDLSAVASSVTSAAAKGAKWYMHRTIFDKVRTLRAGDGHYIYAAPSGQQPGTIWGYPYELTDVMPSITATAAATPFMAFGNPRHIYLGDRSRMTLAQSNAPGFTTDEIYFRVIQREAIVLGIASAFGVLKTAAA